MSTDKTDKIRDKLIELTELCENTTGGQWWRWTVEAWKVKQNEGPFCVGDDHDLLDLEVDDFGNAEFIAQSHQQMPLILNALEAVVEECEDALEAHDGFEANRLSQILLRKIANELDVEES